LSAKLVKIGIYDRYLDTAGGGERYSCKMAEILSRQPGYKVELVSDIFADIKKVESRLNLDLSKVSFKIFPFLSEEYAKKVTGSYDLFINCTYLSPLPGYGKRNMYLCYFPTAFDVDFKFIHRFLLLFFRKPAIWLYGMAEKVSGSHKNIEVCEGVYDIKRFFLLRGGWTSGSVVIYYRNAKDSINIDVKNPASSGLEKMYCSIALLRVGKNGTNKEEESPPGSSTDKTEIIFSRKIELSPGAVEEINIPVAQKFREQLLELKVDSGTFIPARAEGGRQDTRILGAVIYNRQKIGPLKKILLRLVGFIPLFLVTFPKDLSFLDTYDRIISISRYSRKYVEKSWKKESTILFPPVDTKDFSASKKQKIILSVGRFFPEHHNKKQLELAKNFMELYEEYPETMSGYTLYLAGGVEDKPSHLAYVEEIKKISSGYPVNVLANLEWAELVGLFSKAQIFWHAAGMGEDEGSHPEKFEHFGITTVEAMASGCIPVVINRGGQSEIIENGFNGFLFDTWEQLKALTLDICRHADTSSVFINMKDNAIKGAERFSSARFKQKLLEIISDELKQINNS
jgi:glycosyltransferase involved in cell wall biosynthesis